MERSESIFFLHGSEFAIPNYALKNGLACFYFILEANKLKGTKYN